MTAFFAAVRFSPRTMAVTSSPRSTASLTIRLPRLAVRAYHCNLHIRFLPDVCLSEFAVFVLPGRAVGDGFHHVPVLGDLARFPRARGRNSWSARRRMCPRTRPARNCPAPGSCASRRRSSRCRPRSTPPARVQAGNAVGNGRVVLYVGVPVKVFGRLCQVVALHDIVEEVFHQEAVVLGFVQVGRFRGAVGLRVPRGVGRGEGREVVPVLGDQTVLKAEDVEGHLFAAPAKL